MSAIVIYTTEDGATKIDLRLENGAVWLSQLQIAELFQTSKQNISKHIQAIYDDHELDDKPTVNKELTVQMDNSGKISHTQAVNKAKFEYQKYKAKTLDNVEKNYLKTISALENQAKNVAKNEQD